MLAGQKAGLLNKGMIAHFVEGIGYSPSSGLTFSAPLITSLVPEHAVGSATPTFTRATTAYVMDWEGLLRPVLSGEARFTGARRVENKLSNTETLTAGAGWTVSNATSVVGATDPLGGTTAYTMTATGANGQVYRSFSLPAGQVQVNSGWIKRLSGSGNVGLIDPSGSLQVIPVTTSWQRVSTLLASGGTGYCGFQIATSGDSIAIWHPQAEVVTGQSNQNPSEYVSVNVLSAPFHGANVDGVKYFDTLNGNTVASNVVTEATGAAITSANSSTLTTDAYGPYGYLAEGARTNLCLQSEDFATTWTKTVVGDTLTTNAAIAPNGTLTADMLTGDGTATTHDVRQGSIATAAQSTTSVFLKAGTTTWAYIHVLGRTATVDNGDIVWFNLATGAVGTQGASAVGSITAYPNGWYRCSVKTGAAFAGATVTEVRVGVTTADSSESSSSAGTMYMWGGQLEAATFASSYIPTTTASVARAADVLTYPIAGNFGTTQGSAYAEMGLSLNSIPLQLAVSGADALLHMGVATAASFDGTTSVSCAGVAAYPQKVAVKYDSNGGTPYKCFASGNLGTGSAFSGGINGGATMNIGGISGREPYATIRNVRSYNRALNDGQLQNMTT